MNFAFDFYNLRLTPWIWTSPSNKGLKFESPSKSNPYEASIIEDSNLEHCLGPHVIRPFISIVKCWVSEHLVGKAPSQQQQESQAENVTWGLGVIVYTLATLHTRHLPSLSRTRMFWASTLVQKTLTWLGSSQELGASSSSTSPHSPPNRSRTLGDPTATGSHVILMGRRKRFHLTLY